MTPEELVADRDRRVREAERRRASILILMVKDLVVTDPDDEIAAAIGAALEAARLAILGVDEPEIASEAPHAS